ncbi:MULTISPECIES: 2-isopropylmalate synthase [unclassified Actinoplanes]|uniref:2-isopropylmalate synthase n=1 Tax=unclassified Actinoplanes TaxID=2626549 RepID=UPI001E346CC0|nr:MULTISPECIES: 2-isopropylmalate synthase [unclassified Actinoplanes]
MRLVSSACHCWKVAFRVETRIVLDIPTIQAVRSWPLRVGYGPDRDAFRGAASQPPRRGLIRRPAPRRGGCSCFAGRCPFPGKPVLEPRHDHLESAAAQPDAVPPLPPRPRAGRRADHRPHLAHPAADRRPLWVPVDLRDGNQALAEPMDADRKLRAFTMMVAMGFKEIEVGYPSASGLDFDFVRLLAERDDLVPDDVTVVVFTAARDDLIRRTVASIDGLARAVVHMYTATAPTWRDVVLRASRAGLRTRILHAAGVVLSETDRLAHTYTRFEFSPEVFNLTEPEFVLDVCNAVTGRWDAAPDRPVIHNLPATVECATPNVYADQIEWMSRHLDRRNDVILSVHPHNDRGTGVACAELAVLAGAQRVEGCLFGNGERTGNVDLVTLAMNLYTQGIDPKLDFSDIDAVRRTVEHYNRMPVPDRHPYAGDLVYTAFSGTHQDAIDKGMIFHAKRAAALGVPESEAPWEVPYLPVDPADVGRSYEAVIRVNSQSGKGGVAYLLRTGHGLDLPPGLRVEVGALAQAASEGRAGGGELTPAELWSLFRDEYLVHPGFPVDLDGVEVIEEVTGNFREAIISYVRCRIAEVERWGAGVGSTPEAARHAAMSSAARRAV